MFPRTRNNGQKWDNHLKKSRPVLVNVFSTEVTRGLRPSVADTLKRKEEGWAVSSFRGAQPRSDGPILC
jgi:hypothetical protein